MKYRDKTDWFASESDVNLHTYLWNDLFDCVVEVLMVEFPDMNWKRESKDRWGGYVKCYFVSSAGMKLRVRLDDTGLLNVQILHDQIHSTDGDKFFLNRERYLGGSTKREMADLIKSEVKAGITEGIQEFEKLVNVLLDDIENHCESRNKRGRS